jgi:hypothetical protein
MRPWFGGCGLIHGIEEAGKELKQNFPQAASADLNELPNEVDLT